MKNPANIGTKLAYYELFSIGLLIETKKRNHCPDAEYPRNNFW